MKRTLAFVAFLIAAFACRAEDLGRPLLLVASPALQGAYSHTTLLVFPMREQHAGFILNRSTDVKMASVFPEHPPSAKVAEPIYFGGPEMADSLFALVRKDPGQGAVRVLNDLFVTAESDCIDRIIEQTPNDARYFAGFVGWRPGELAKEIEAGYWYVEQFDAAQAFRKDSGSMWEELVERLGNGHPRATDLHGV
ncbi:MAG TPA: YqgE/AlgH family protein [Burkholderiales bacterium]|jgi:putative transcriptional regulator|nr:YqgE/AlgH family protein [Burkholderiales bacterium]